MAGLALVAVLIGGLVGYRAGAYALAAVLAGAAVARGMLPVRRAGALAVRSRGLDVTVLVLLAVALAVLAEAVPRGG